MKNVFDLALRSVTEGHAAVLVTVVEHQGSVPGTTGAAMVVSDRGCAGTVGGGTAEHQMIERALAIENRAELVEIIHTSEESGSLCSGRHTMALIRLESGDRHALEEIDAALCANGYGLLALGTEGIAFQAGVNAPATLERGGEGWRFSTTIGSLDTLYIAGGGHVALALSRVMTTLPFRVVVFDNRCDLPTMADNTFAHQTLVVDYPEIADHIADGDGSWVVIMTFGHTHDASVLEALTGKTLRYLGLMGSTAKVSRMFHDLRRRGVPAEHLERVSAPVGLSIGSHTPEEIAISIAAEIIKISNAMS